MTSVRGSVLAIDVGATTIKGARLSASGRYEQECAAATGTNDAAIRTLLEVCDALCTPDCLGVALAVAGNLDIRAGVVRYAVNIGWRRLGLRDLVAEKLSLPVTLIHDVQAACVAEKTLGMGKNSRNLLTVVIGTGVGAGLVVDGQHVLGATSSAGELGHLMVRPGGELCACGQLGCLEVYASGAGIARRHAALGGPAALTAADVARSSTPAARTAWDDATQTLGQALAAATVLIDPDLIVLAGGLSHAGARLAAPVEASLRAQLAWRSAPTLQLSSLGSRGGVLGAAIAAWRACGYPHTPRDWTLEQMNPTSTP